MQCMGHLDQEIYALDSIKSFLHILAYSLFSLFSFPFPSFLFPFFPPFPFLFFLSSFLHSFQMELLIMLFWFTLLNLLVFLIKRLSQHLVIARWHSFFYLPKEVLFLFVFLFSFLPPFHPSFLPFFSLSFLVFFAPWIVSVYPQVPFCFSPWSSVFHVGDFPLKSGELWLKRDTLKLIRTVCFRRIMSDKDGFSIGWSGSHRPFHWVILKCQHL